MMNSIINSCPDILSVLIRFFKEEKLRQQKIANSLANQALQNDAILALKNLKVVPSSSPKSTTKGGGSRQIVEVDRTRSDVSSKFCKDSLGTSSSPLTCKRRQQILRFFFKFWVTLVEISALPSSHKNFFM